MFESLWLESALDQLAVIYIAVDAQNRTRLAEGVERLNNRLASDPLDVGESRAGGFRVAFTPLLSTRNLITVPFGVFGTGFGW